MRLVLDVKFIIATEGDNTIMGTLGALSQNTPTEFRPRVGALEFSSVKHATLTLRIKTDDPLEAIAVALDRVRSSFELFGKSAPGTVEIKVGPAEP